MVTQVQWYDYITQVETKGTPHEFTSVNSVTFMVVPTRPSTQSKIGARIERHEHLINRIIAY